MYEEEQDIKEEQGGDVFTPSKTIKSRLDADYYDENSEFVDDGEDFFDDEGGFGFQADPNEDEDEGADIN